MQTDWFLWIFIKWCFYEFLHFYLSYLSINCIRSCCCWQLKMIRCHWCLFVHLSLWVLSIKLRVLLLFRQLWAVYRNTHTILLRSFVVPPRKMMFTFVTATEKTNNNNNPSRLFQLCHTRHIWCSDAIQLLFTANLCCWFLLQLVVHYPIVTIVSHCGHAVHNNSSHVVVVVVVDHIAK